MLFTISLMPFLAHVSGLLYLVCAVGQGAGFVYHAARLYGDRDAMATFGYSVLYLTALFAVLLADHDVMEIVGG